MSNYERRVRQYSIFLGVLLGLLLLQFALGMFTNLFSSFPPPPAHPQQGLAVVQEILSSGLPVVIVHATNGMLMLAIAAVTVVLARRAHQRYLFGLALIGLFSIFVAADSGYRFVYYGWTDDLFSYTMCLGFVSALAANLVALSIVLRAVVQAVPAPDSTRNAERQKRVVGDLKQQ